VNPTQTKPTDELAPGVPITMTPLYKVLTAQLSPRIEAFLFSKYLERSGGKLPSVARTEDLTTKAMKAMKEAIEQAYDLKLPGKLVVPNVMQTIQELLDRELDGEFGAEL
jgi:hypothetical protein